MTLTGDERPPTILVTEPDAIVRMMIVDLLADAGIEAIEARDAQEGLARLADHPGVHLLVTGRSLPGDVDGVTFAHVARRRRPDLGIVVTTGGRGLEPATLPDGAVQLRKPYMVATLLGAVRRLLPDSERMSEAETATGAAFVPHGLPSPPAGPGASGTGEIAAPLSEPDKS